MSIECINVTLLITDDKYIFRRNFFIEKKNICSEKMFTFKNKNVIIFLFVLANYGKFCIKAFTGDIWIDLSWYLNISLWEISRRL